MPDIRMTRAHDLGLKKAREIAWRWAEQCEQEFGMECTVVEGEDHDLVEFMRSGVEGTLRVTAASFELHARLGILLGAFARRIEAEIEKNLDALLVQEAPPARKAAAKKAAPKKG